MSERDTYFADFARLVWEKMLSQTQWQGIDVTAGHIPLHHPEDEEHQTYIRIIAHYASELVSLALSEVDVFLETYPTELNHYHREHFIQHIATLAGQPEYLQAEPMEEGDSTAEPM